MPKTRLLNAAVMPRAGTYTVRALTREEYAAAVRAAYAAGTVASYIGYDATADVIEQITGVRPEVTRQNTPVEHGDTLLICRLRQRVQSQDWRDKVASGREQTNPDAYEFFSCTYREG